MKIPATGGECCSHCSLEKGDEGRRCSVLPSSSVTGEGNTRERQGKGPQPNRAGPVPTGQSEGGAQEAQHRHLKTPGPWRVAPTGSLRTADHAEGGPQLPTVLFEGQLSMAKQQMANRPRTQGHFCKTTGLVSLKTQRPE